jgi:hypothetical protein
MNTNLLPWRAPGAAYSDGFMRCPCGSWARPVDRNFLDASYGRQPLDHAPLCDGHGEPSRPEPSELSEFMRGAR